MTRPNNQPRPSRRPQSQEPAPRGRRVAGTRRTTSIITESMQKYIDSLPRGERGKARNVMSAYRNFGNMEPSEAIARYKQRKSDDARTPLDNAGDFEDELGTDDESDFEEPTGGALTMQMSGLMSNDEFTQSHPELTARLRARALACQGVTKSRRAVQNWSPRETARERHVGLKQRNGSASRRLRHNSTVAGTCGADWRRGHSLSQFHKPSCPTWTLFASLTGLPALLTGAAPVSRVCQVFG